MVFPLLLCFFYFSKWLTISLLLFMALLDYLDGPLARSRGQVSLAGKLLDPFADKIMILPIFYLAALPILPLWLIWLTIGLEALLVLLVFLLKPFFEKLGIKRSVGANKFGKYKMTLQTVGVFWLLIAAPTSANNAITYYLFLAALVLSAGSIIKHLMPAADLEGPEAHS